MKKIKLKMGVTSVIITAVCLACVILVNAIFSVISDKLPMKIDLTQDKVYEFSEQTKELMKNLDSEITAYALIPDGTQGEMIDYMREYLDKYKSLSKNFKVKYIDPYKDPAFMQKYNDGETQANAGSVIIESGESFKVISLDQIYTQGFDGSTQIDMEKKVTNAVMNVTGKLSGAKVYFTEGHGEYESREFASALTEEGYKKESVSLSMNAVPDDAKILISLAPQIDFTEEERNALDAYMDKGGKFIYVTAPGATPMERIDSYLKEWGMKLNYDYVIEKDSNKALSRGNGLPIPVPELREHPITEKLMGAKSPLLSPDSTSISFVKSPISAQTTSLMETSDKSYGKTDLTSSAEKNDSDIEGPLTVAAISEKRGEETGSAILVLGSLAGVEAQGILSEGAYLNGDFVLNAVNYLVGENKGTGIRAKQVSAERMTMTPNQVVIWMLVLQYVLPIIIILIGLVVWLRRRYK